MAAGDDPPIARHRQAGSQRLVAAWRAEDRDQGAYLLIPNAPANECQRVDRPTLASALEQQLDHPVAAEANPPAEVVVVAGRIIGDEGRLPVAETPPGPPHQIALQTAAADRAGDPAVLCDHQARPGPPVRRASHRTERRPQERLSVLAEGIGRRDQRSKLAHWPVTAARPA